MYRNCSKFTWDAPYACVTGGRKGFYFKDFTIYAFRASWQRRQVDFSSVLFNIFNIELRRSSVPAWERRILFLAAGLYNRPPVTLLGSSIESFNRPGGGGPAPIVNTWSPGTGGRPGDCRVGSVSAPGSARDGSPSSWRPPQRPGTVSCTYRIVVVWIYYRKYCDFCFLRICTV